jgi:mycothiol synthase
VAGGPAARDSDQEDGAITVKATDSLAPTDAAAVLQLVGEAARADGVSPLSEHVVLHLKYGGDPQGRDVLLCYEGRLAGYGHLDPTDRVEGPVAEMVIRPALRRRGLGRAVGSALVSEADGADLRLWAHGDLPAAAGLAAAVGFYRSRALWQMRRSLSAELTEPQLPAGVSVRTFRVGLDEDAWLAVNSRAFARHPEQGAWTRSDLELREREPWFDPAGFFLAERDGALAGFHWTKVHGSARRDSAVASGGAPQPAIDREAIGEVYVVGVDPAEQGTGLGRALTVIGIRYLRSLDLAEVMLYVDESNTAAIGLYASLGFVHSGTDVMFSREGTEPAAEG